MSCTVYIIMVGTFYAFYFWILQYIHFLFYGAAKTPAPVETLLTKTQQYIEDKKSQFLRTYDVAGLAYSSSICASFYSPEVIKMILDNPANELEPLWRSRILMESTPRGNVIMHYDAYKQGFSYYADTNSLPYSLLNAVAMKYVITYRCRDFFLDEKVTPEDKPSPLLPKPVATAAVQKKRLTSDVDDKSPFLKPKRSTQQQQQKTTEPKPEPEKEYSTNRFLYLGKCANFKFLHTAPKKNKMNGFSSQYTADLAGETQLQQQVLNYGDFKKKQKQQQQQVLE